MHSTHRIRRSGFTLIELMIVIAIIATIVAMGIPKLMAARLTANEASAISTLRSLTTAEVAVMASGGIDSDGDGAGEDGFFGELAGTAAARDTAGGAAIIGIHRLNPIVLSSAFGHVDASGQVSRSGYIFQLWLPGTPAGGATPGVSELPTVGGADPANMPDSDGCEVLWCCYAWPILATRSGNRTFFINQTGELLQTDNRGPAPYSATVKMPGFDEAYLVAGDMGSKLRVGVAGGSDNTVWVAVQ